MNGVEIERAQVPRSREGGAPTRTQVPRRQSSLDPRVLQSIPHIDATLRSGGSALPQGVPGDRTGRLGHDFSQVRVYSDHSAAEAASILKADAFTYGRHIFFGSGKYSLGEEGGQDLLAHELVHVTQQGDASTTGVSTDRRQSLERSARAHDFTSSSSAGAMALQRQSPDEGEDERWPPPGLEEYLATRLASQAPPRSAQGQPPTRCIGHNCHDYLNPPRPRIPDFEPIDLTRRLNFFHGTRWTTARQIPGRVDPTRGGGDFGQGFYLHYDTNTERARQRAVRWGRIIARQPPTEPYAGVIRFSVRQGDYAALFVTGGGGRTFDLRRTDQPDFAQRQREWLNFVTSGGRQSQPSFTNPERGVEQWRHERRPTQPDLGYNVIRGPFYRGVPGTPGTPPPRSAFVPYSEGSRIPEQQLWAHAGTDLLNSNRVTKELTQYRVDTGERVDPPIEMSFDLRATPNDQAAAEKAQRIMTGP